MSKTIGTPGNRATNAPATPQRPTKNRDAGASQPVKSRLSGIAAKIAEKKGGADVRRAARAEAARAARRTNMAEEPKDAGDVDNNNLDDIDELAHQKAHRSTHHHKAFGADDELDDLMKSEAEAESGAVTDLGISRKGMGGGMGGDGFEGNQDEKNREAYEQYLRGNVKTDQERFDQLRKGGATDTFRPELTPVEVEKLGHPRAATHIVRLYDAMTLDGKSHDECVQKTKELLVGFTRPDSVRKVLQELESKPIRDVYPLEVMMKILDENPDALPGVARGAVIANAGDLAGGEKAFAGHPFPVHVPVDARIKAFALLGGARPGYEFFPAPEQGRYTMQIDTPGTWQFALLAAPLTSLGRIQKESGDAIIEVFQVVVRQMGRKGELLADPDDDDGPDLGATLQAAMASMSAKPAPSIAEQLRPALDAIVKHDAGPKATTYSWDVTLWRPGAPMAGEPILHVVVDKAGPFDPAWAKAAEAVAKKQMEFEPARKPISLMDLQFALKRARVS